MTAPPGIRIETFHGEAAAPYLPALAKLRVEVFRDWPYLYDGNAASETSYLAALARSRDAGLVLAFDGAEPVGCATCAPMADENANVTAPFRAQGWDLGRFFYFGESVLRRSYRGRGIGVAFFAAREAHARAVSRADFAAFCAVIRPPEHPLRPADATPLDPFWRRRGFTPRPDLTCTMRWKQVDTAGEVENRLGFWLKSLSGAPLP